jgi:hypothetical protein
LLVVAVVVLLSGLQGLAVMAVVVLRVGLHRLHGLVDPGSNTW